MNIGGELDRLAAEERVSSVQLIKVGKVWQAYVNLAAGPTSARRAATPSEALQTALETLPGLEAYEVRYGVTGVNARALAEYVEVPICPICDQPQFDTPHGDTCVNGHGGEPPKVVEPAGVFD